MIFLSTSIQKIGKNNRVSLPNNFRDALAKEDFKGVVCFASFVNKAIEGCAMSRMHQLSESIDKLEPYSDERDALATSILGGSEVLSLDNAGRLVLTDKLKKSADLKKEALFIGKGATFEIWNPDHFAKYEIIARKKAQEKRYSLNLSNINKNK